MAKSDPINTANPAGSSNRRDGDDYIRTLARAIAELMGINHYMDASSPYSSDSCGQHSKVEFASAQTAPAIGSLFGIVYSDVSGELHYKDSSGNDKTLTNAGQLNIVDADGAVLKTGNQTIAGVKTFSGIPVFSSGAACGSSKLTAVANPTANQDAATKNYVDTFCDNSKTATSTSDLSLTASEQDIPSLTFSFTPSSTRALILVDIQPWCKSNDAQAYAYVYFDAVKKKTAKHSAFSGSGVFSFHDLVTGLTAGQTYTVKVTAKETSGSVDLHGSVAPHQLTAIDLP